MSVHASTMVLVNMSESTVFTEGLKWVWGSNDSGKWPQGPTGCWGMCHFSLTPMVTSGDIKKAFYTQRDIHRSIHSHMLPTHISYTSIKTVVWQSSEMSSEEVCVCLFLSLRLGLELQHAHADNIKHSLEPSVAQFHSAPRAEQELICHCS